MAADTRKKLRPYSPFAPYLYLLPPLVLLGVFMFWPMVQSIIYSFQRYNVFIEPEWLGLANYRELLQDSAFWNAFTNSLKYWIGVVPALVFLPILIAVLVNQDVPGTRFFRTLYFFPVVTSMVVAGIAWRWIFAERGLLNFMVVRFVPFVDEGIGWLTTARFALPSVMVVTIWKGLGYYMVIYLAGLQSIPHQLYEAATIDGASRFRKLWSITIPQLAPYMVLVAILSSIAAMKVFDEVYVTTGGGPFGSSRTLVFEVYDQAFNKLNMGYGSAMGVVLFIILLIFSAVSLRISER